MQPQYQDFNHYPSERPAVSAAESRPYSQLHPHPLFARQGNAGPSIRNRSLELHHAAYGSPSPFQVTPQQSWPPYDIPQYSSGYLPYPSPSPFPAPRLSPPPVHHSPVNFKYSQNNSDPTSSQNHRLTFAGSFDPETGIFHPRTPGTGNPRLRTAQACEKCRTRKAKVRTPF